MAVTLDSAGLAARVAGLSDDDTATQLLAVSTALVERFAGAAPSAVQNEAAIRVSGWLKRNTSVESVNAGPVRMRFQRTASRNVMRDSGAMGLLSAWHRPKAIVIEDDD